MERLQEICDKGPYKIVLSNKRPENTEYERAEILKKEIRGTMQYQIAKFTEKQVFHMNIGESDLYDVVNNLMETGFYQLTAWDMQSIYQLRVTKKGKVLFRKEMNKNPNPILSHNTVKNYKIPEGVVVPPLVDLGIFTKDGKVVNSQYDKYKQINRFLEMVEDVTGNYNKEETLHIIDFGCGKSYLTFILYYYLTEVKKQAVEIVGLDLKEDVIKKCNATAKKYGYDHLHFEVGNIDGYHTKMPVDMVITLHACDTATDFALYNAICWKAKIILSVPCCQHELNHQMETDSLKLLTRYGIIKERTAALYTDAIRANLLEYCGYHTQLLEFIDMTHSPKNILIRAVKDNKIDAGSRRKSMLNEVEQCMETFHLQPTLYRLLMEEKDKK